MPFTEQGLPFAAHSHTSYKAARSIRSRGQKSRLYLRCLGLGPATDHQMASAVQVPLSSVTSIRNGLMHAGLVEKCGEVVGPYGKDCAIWTLTEAGRAAVGKL